MYVGFWGLEGFSWICVDYDGVFSFMFMRETDGEHSISFRGVGLGGTTP